MFSIAKQKIENSSGVKIIIPHKERNIYLNVILEITKRYHWYLSKEYPIVHLGENCTAVNIVDYNNSLFSTIGLCYTRQ